jgi:hypothetical protein
MFKFFSSWPVWAVFQSLVCLGLIFLLVAVIPIFLPDLAILDAPNLIIDSWLCATVVIAVYAFLMAVRDRKKELEKAQTEQGKQVGRALIDWQIKSLSEAICVNFEKEDARLEILNIAQEKKLCVCEFKYKKHIYIFESSKLVKHHNLLLKEIEYKSARHLVLYNDYKVTYISMNGTLGNKRFFNRNVNIGDKI